MPDFDPYRKWLGIKPEEQPPNLYRLLGISLFEDDPDVIDAAVEQRVTFLQTCASGPNLKHSQKLLNEIAEARNVLMDAERKEAYDAEMTSALAAPEPTATADSPQSANGTDRLTDGRSDNQTTPADWKSRRKTVADEPVPAPESRPIPPEKPAGSGSRPAVSVAAQLRKRRSRSTGMIAAIILAVGATGGFLWWLVNGDGSEVLEDIGQVASGGHDPGQRSGPESSTGRDSPKDNGPKPESTDGTATRTGTGTDSNTGETGTDQTGTSVTPATETGSTGTEATSRVSVTPRRDAADLASQKPSIVHTFRDGHESDVVAVAISNDLNVIASAEANGIVVTRSLADEGKILDRFEVDGKILGLTFHSASDEYAVLTPETIYFRDFVNQRISWRERPLTAPEFTCIAHRPFTPFYLAGRLDGTAVLRGPGESGDPGSRHRLVGHEGPVTCLAVSATGRLAVTASEDKTLRLWHVDTKKEIGKYPVDAVMTAVAISTDERRIVGLSQKGLHSWDLFTERPYPVLPTADSDDAGLALIADQPFAVLTGSDSAITAVNLKTMQTTKPITAGAGFPMRLLAVSPDGVGAVMAGLYPESEGSSDSIVSVWRLPEFSEVTFAAPDELPQNILPLVRIDRDVIQGSWTHNGEILTSGTEPQNGIHLPASVPLEYTLHLRVRRSSGMGPLRIHLPFHDTVARLIINGDGGRFSGLEFVDGMPLEEARIGFDSRWIVSWKRTHTIQATVTEEGITAMVDQQVLFEWEGTPDQLRDHPGRNPALPFVRELSLNASSAQYEFSSIQLLPVDGEPGTFTSSPLALSKPAVDQVETPPAAEQTAEREKLRATFAELYADTQNRQTLIAQLIKLSGESQESVATHYIALSEAAVLAAESGDASQAFLTLEELNARFDGLHSELKEQVFSLLFRKRDKATMSQLVLFGFNWVEDLLDADRFEEASSVLSRVRGVAVRLKDSRLRELADYLSTRIRTLSRAFEPVKPHVLKLAEDPDDATAAEAVGMFRCFVQEDWERGLPLLQKASNTTVRQLAFQDLAAPATPVEQTALADAWWAYSTRRPAADRDAIRRRSGYWYVNAILALPSNQQTEIRSKEQRVPSVPATITIAARVDAGDTLTIRRDGAIWESTHSAPADVYINRYPWDVRSEKVLLNRGAGRFLPVGVHFARARLQKVQGRSNVDMSVSADEIIIRFNDSFVGAGIYQLLLTFGS